MKKQLLYLFCVLGICMCQKANAQVTVTNNLTVEQYVNSVLVGSGVTISNVQFNGGTANIVNEQVGEFTDPNLDIGIAGGLIMGSGDVTMAAQLNNSGSSSLGGPSTMGSDADLQGITVNQIWDECVIEFDFIPSGDTISFNYVFASEEYEEYVCGSVNDAFGFFLTGPNPAGGNYNAKNIALIPDPANPGQYTNTPVSINTVNPGVAGSFGTASTCAAIDPNWASYNVFYAANSSNNYEYDGSTTVLQASAKVQCGVTYHIKLAIGDGGDNVFDSGVFLQEGSFSSNEVKLSLQTAVPSLTLDSTVIDSVIVEGCTQATFTFTRNDTSDADTINFTIGGNAINGVDYAFLPNYVILDTGEFTADLQIIPFADALMEPTDTIIFSIQQVDACGNITIVDARVYILEDYQIQINTADLISICPGDSVALHAIGSGGIEPFNYTWSTGGNDTVEYVQPMNNDTFFVTVGDSCGYTTAVDTVAVTIQMIPPTVTVSNDTVLYCVGDTVPINANGASGTGSGYQYNWDTGDTTATIITNPTTDSLFIVTVVDDCGILSVTDTVSVSFTVPQLYVNTSADTTLECEGDTAQLLIVSGGGGTPNYQYTWSTTEVNDTVDVVPGATTTYYVTISDACGGAPASDSVTVTVTTYDPLDISDQDTFVVCASDPFVLNPVVTGGNPAYTYSWNNGGGTSSLSGNADSTTLYILSVTDQCGSDTVNTFLVTVPVYPTIMVSANDTQVYCPGQSITIEAFATGGMPNTYTYSWNWNNGSVLSNDSIITITQTDSTSFGEVIITDFCGHSDTEIVVLTVPVFDSLTLNVLDGGLICLDDSANLVVEAVGGNGTYFYSWTGAGTILEYENDTAVAIPSDNTTYNISVDDGCGNNAIGETNLEVEACAITIPSVFSPNGDGINDVFWIKQIEKFPGSRVTILNRWGHQVWPNPSTDSGDYDNVNVVWRGLNYDGGELSEGTYYYIITRPNNDDDKGYVSLVKGD